MGLEGVDGQRMGWMGSDGVNGGHGWDEIMKIGEMIYFRVVMIGNIIGITKLLEGGGRPICSVRAQEYDSRLMYFIKKNPHIGLSEHPGIQLMIRVFHQKILILGLVSAQKYD